jgi:MFS family permease
VVQGIGGGLLLPVLTTLLVQAAGGRPLGKLMATVSLPAVLVPILGPVVGGLIVSNLNWRWIFYVNVPICRSTTRKSAARACLAPDCCSRRRGSAPCCRARWPAG